jgi:hypothetical protein
MKNERRETEEVTNLQKVRTLQKANPKLTEKEACLLLGIKQDDLEKEKLKDIEIPNFINNLFGGFKK